MSLPGDEFHSILVIMVISMLWVLGATASTGVHERARVKESKWGLRGGGCCCV